MSHYFASHAQKLQALGYDIVPISPLEKAIHIKGWQTKNFDKLIANPGRQGYKGCSHRTATAPAIDVDVTDEGLANQLCIWLADRGFDSFRYGARPKFACIAQWTEDGPQKKMFSSSYECGKIEILGEGQQIVLFNTHPDGFEYEWTDELQPVLDLPVLTDKLLSELFAFYDSIVGDRYMKLADSKKQTDVQSAPVEHLAQDQIEARLRPLDPNCSYDEWVRTGMAIYHHGGTAHDWIAWSEPGSDYPGDDALLKKWDSFRTDGAKASLEEPFDDIADLLTEQLLKLDQAVVERESQTMFRSFGDMLATRKDPDWLIKGVIERNTVSLLFGDFVAFKSFIALDMALHVATEEMNWRGRITNHGPVFFLAGEGHGGLDRRIQAWANHHEVNESNFHASTIPPNLSNPESMRKMLQVIDRLSAVRPALIIIDTLASSSGGADENNASDISKILQEINIARRTFECAVILVHHTGQKEKDRARGSYALPAGVDTMYRAKREAESMQVTVANTKMKDGRPPEDMVFEAVEVVLGQDQDGEDVTSLVIAHDSLSPAEAYVIGLGVKGATATAVEVLFDAGGEMQLSAWSEETQDRLKGMKSPKQAFYKAKKQLTDSEKVEISGVTVKLAIPLLSMTYPVTPGGDSEGENEG